MAHSLEMEVSSGCAGASKEGDARLEVLHCLLQLLKQLGLLNAVTKELTGLGMETARGLSQASPVRERGWLETPRRRCSALMLYIWQSKSILWQENQAFWL